MSDDKLTWAMRLLLCFMNFFKCKRKYIKYMNYELQFSVQPAVFLSIIIDLEIIAQATIDIDSAVNRGAGCNGPCCCLIKMIILYYPAVVIGIE